MRLAKPRIEPVADDKLTPDQAELLAPMLKDGRPVLNVFRTLIAAPKAAKGFLAWANYVLSRRNRITARTFARPDPGVFVRPKKRKKVER